MRNESLFMLAYFCHLRPRDVDELTVADFLALVDACERQKHALEGD